MRFLVMVFLSLFLMTNVSVAEPVNCPDLKKKIEKSHYNAEEFLKQSLRLRKEKQPDTAKDLYDASNNWLDDAAKHATIYIALCK